MESLEHRDVPAALIALTSTNTLLSFDSATPGTTTTTAITGLTAGDNLVGLDHRASNNLYYGISDTSRIYTINAKTGVATAVSATPFTPAISGSNIGFDLNPVPDKLRVISNGQSIRVDPGTGLTLGTDTAPFFNATSYADFFTGTAPTPQLAAAAYTKNVDGGTLATITTLYGIDSNLDVLVIQGGPDGDPSPNGGELTIVDVLGFDAGSDTSFDIQSGTDAAFVSTGGQLYSLNITTGASTKLGAVGLGLPNIRGLAVAPSAAGAGTLALSANTYTFNSDRDPLAVEVTRTGGATGPVTIDFATTDGTATSPSDYFANKGTLTFADGDTSETIFLNLPAGTPTPSPSETFTLTLSNVAGGATIGTNGTAIVTIPAVTAVPVPTRFLAVGAGVGNLPQVEIRDALTGASVGSFLGYEASFSGGVTVATGDVNGDGTDDAVVGAGPRGGPRIRVFDGTTLGNANPTILADFFAYESEFRGGVTVATGDIDGDGFDDVVVGSGNGGGPRIRVFDGSKLSTNSQVTLKDFFAYESNFRGGVNVGSGNFNNDGFDDIIAGAGVGGGPRVRVFDGSTNVVLADYFAYDSALRPGVTVAAGDLNNDSKVDVVAGAGNGGGPNIRAFSGLTSNLLANFFAYDSSLRGGVRVGTADFNDDGNFEIVAGGGTDGPRSIRFFNTAGTSQFSYDAFNATFSGGAYVG